MSVRIKAIRADRSRLQRRSQSSDGDGKQPSMCLWYPDIQVIFFSWVGRDESPTEKHPDCKHESRIVSFTLNTISCTAVVIVFFQEVSLCLASFLLHHTRLVVLMENSGSASVNRVRTALTCQLSQCGFSTHQQTLCLLVSPVSPRDRVSPVSPVTADL